MATTHTRVLWTAQAGDVLTGARLAVQTTFTKHATDYWTVTVRHRRAAIGPFAAQSTGEIVGTAFSGANTTLTANQSVTLYGAAVGETGVSLSEGDQIVAYVTDAGSPAALDDPRITLDVQRTPR